MISILSKASFSEEDSEESGLIPMISEDDEQCLSQTDLPDTLPILPLRNMVLFPGVAMPVSIGRNKSLRLVRDAYQQNTIIAVFTQKDAQTEEPVKEDLARVGVVSRILRILEMPDNSTTIILQAINRCELDELTGTEPYLKGRIRLREEIMPQRQDRKFEALIQAIKDLSVKIIRNSSGNLPQEAIFAIRNIEKPYALVNFICANFAIKIQDKIDLLETDEFRQRCYRLLDIMTKESQLLELKMSIQSKTKEGIDQQQREYFLQQQIKTIQSELGGTAQEQDAREMREKAKTKKWSEETAEIFEKEMKKLEAMSPYSPDYSTQMNYLQTLLDLPWGEYSKDNFNLRRAKKTLDKDHFGLDKVKERILEHLAVLKLKGNLKSPIICLYGPPGVGKTSLGRSIAESLGRKYLRISLGGLHDEAEIRGHRRTYIGAMPGRIIKGLIKAGTSNPVFILDEIDKVSRDVHGDPSYALLEVLDPEQNNTFHDNFVDIDYDLSKVLFIATANSLSTVPQPLLDRMELIDVSGYIAEEKVEIALRHLLPREMDNHGIAPGLLSMDKAAIRQLIDSYTRESGVRELDKKIAQICRRAAFKIASSKTPQSIEVGAGDLQDYLGVPRYSHERYEGNDYLGVVTGLAWTAAGGEILYIESSLNRSQGGKLTLTGNLGEVMKESAILALEYLKAHCAQLGLKEEIFEEHSVHVHVPEGAVPKDGPSAGITILTSLASAFTRRKVRKNLAMTGEMTLRGQVLPVGGIKEKILAAKRAGIKEIILSQENRKDIEEIQSVYLKGLKFHYVSRAEEVLQLALLK
ncbi:MAG: endopeptidase La [Bacteroidales bacterium]|nr:endopeptidase La [Bacteroidales bacterium]